MRKIHKVNAIACAGDRDRVRIAPTGPRGGRTTTLPSCISEESERSLPGNAGGIGQAVGGGHRRGSQAVRKAPDNDHDLSTSSGPGDRCRRPALRDSRAVRLESRQQACPASAVSADHGSEAVHVRALERRRWQPARRDGRRGIHVVRGELHRAAKDAGLRRPARGRVAGTACRRCRPWCSTTARAAGGR